MVGSWLFCLQDLPSLVSFMCMFGGCVEVWTKNILNRFIEGQTHFSNTTKSYDELKDNSIVQYQNTILISSFMCTFKNLGLGVGLELLVVCQHKILM